MRDAAQQGVYCGLGRLEEMDGGTFSAPEPAREFLHVAVDFVGVQGRRRSHLLLTGARGKFLKLRITGAMGADIDEEARAFVRALNEQLERGG